LEDSATSQTLSLANYEEINLAERTQLTATLAIAANSLPVDNTNDFSSNGFILLGSVGSKNAELVQAASVASAETISLVAPTTLPHNQDEYVYALFGDQFNIYRAPNVDGSLPADSIFQANLIATIPIDPNDDATVYTDSSGGSGYWYKYTHYNSVTTSETDIASSDARRPAANYCSIDDIRTESGFTYAIYITNKTIDAKRQAAQSEIDSTLAPYYTVPFTPPISPLLSDICKRLAAGLLLQEKYNHVNNPDVNGTNKLTEARADLQKLIHPELSGTTLLDANGKSIALPNPNTSASSWPNTDTATTDPAFGGAPRYFRMGMVEGYRSRDF
jgi:hypothetical protein